MRQRARFVEEIPVWLEVDGARHATWTATPGEIDALAVGRLLTDGFITGAQDVVALHVVDDAPCGSLGLRASVRDARRGLEQRRHLAAHGCGVRGLVGCLGRIAPRTRASPPAQDTFPALLADLYEREEAQRGERGGMHGTGIELGGVLRIVVFDVSRHSAVDKALGRALLNGLPLGTCGLVTTARISGEMAAKAAVADVAYVASRSVPTTLAVEIATAAALPLLARAGSPNSEVHGV
jgi:FdhD protein